MKKLFVSVRQGNLDEVKRIIEKEPELVNCVSGKLPKKDHGQSPLQVALKTGQFEIADYLISRGADVNFMEAEDDDPGLRAPVLFDAVNAAVTLLCYMRFDESDTAFRCAEKLVEKGADVNKAASNGYDAISWALSRANLLFERAAVYPESQEAVRKLLVKILDLLIENGADYKSWADRGYYGNACEEPTNRNVYLDESVPKFEKDIERNRAIRLFVQEYFKDRNLCV